MTSSDDAGARPVDRELTAELLARYDRPGPRYTSYPTAVEFDEQVTHAVAEARLAEAATLADEPLSLYLHLPFCEHRCLFCGCHVIITPHKERADPYLALLRREIDLVAGKLGQRRRVSQLHLGGGTPTYHAPEVLADLLDHLLGHVSLTDDAEVAVEVDPRFTTREHIDMLAERGFNRISLGVQDFTREVQEAIERVQSVEETRDIVLHARARGFGSVNVDLIYGLPLQRPETFEQAVEQVIELRPDRLAVYSFALVPWIRGHQRKLMEEQLPTRDVKLSLFGIARERLLGAGYEPIGMDHFALPDDELAVARREGRLRRNFQGYTVIPAEDVVGLGLSAIGDVRGAYLQNRKKLTDYEQALDAGHLPTLRGVVRDRDDDIRRDVISELMCNFRVDLQRIGRRWGIDPAAYFAADLRRLDEHAREGFVTVEDGRIEATPRGELFVRNLAMCFDRYWREKHETSAKPTFSRTV